MVSSDFVQALTPPDESISVSRVDCVLQMFRREGDRLPNQAPGVSGRQVEGFSQIIGVPPLVKA